MVSCKKISIALLLIYPTAAFSNETRITAAALSTVIEKGGLILSSALSGDKRFSLPPSKIPPEQQSAVLNHVIFEVGKIQSKAASEKQANEVTKAKYDIVETIGLGMAAYVPGPWTLGGAALASLGKASANIYLDQANQEIESEALKKTVELIAASKDKILTDMGLSKFSDISTTFGTGAEGRARLSDKLNGANTVFQDLRDRAARAGKPNISGAMQDLMLDVLVRITPKMIDEIEEAHEKISGNSSEIKKIKDSYTELSTKLSDLETVVQSNYERLSDSLTNVETKVREVSTSLSELTTSVSRLGAGQAVIADFMFADMSPSRKIAFLKSGAMDASITCSSNEPDCDRNKVKANLLQHYQKESDAAETFQNIKKFSNNLRDISIIASNLGIDSPELQFTLSTGQNVSNALLSFASSPPNVLGGIAALSGILSKKKDPAQERHKALMTYLSRQFSEINNKLEHVLKNQKTIIEGIQGLSEQVTKSIIHLDRRIDNLTEEIIQTNYNVRRLVWEPWQDCYLLFENAYFDKNAVDRKTFQFRSLKDLEGVLHARAGAARKCINTAFGAFVSSTSAPERFGRFGDIRAVVENGSLLEDTSTEFSTTKIRESEAAKTYLSALSTFLSERHAPSRHFLRYWSRSNGGMASAFALLSRPVSNLDEWNFAKYIVGKEPFVCGRQHHSSARLEPLLCRSLNDQSASNAASMHFETALSIDAISDVVSWIMVVAQVADFYREFPIEGWLTTEQLLAAPTFDEARGEELLRKTIEVLDVALASSSATYGPATAEGILDLLYSDNMSEMKLDAIKLLGNNPILASNFVMLLLNRAGRTDENSEGQGQTKPSFFDYSLAFNQAIQEQVFDPWMFQELFPEDNVFVFVRTESGQPAVRIVSENTSSLVPLPPPFQYSDQDVFWPPSHYRLLQLRSMVMDQWGGYQVMDGLSESERLLILGAL